MSSPCFQPVRSYGGADSPNLVSELVPFSRLGHQCVRLVKLLTANALDSHLFPQAYAKLIILDESGEILYLALYCLFTELSPQLS